MSLPFPCLLVRAVVAVAALLCSVRTALPQEDALPRGAVVRLGSVRFLHKERPRTMAFLPGDKCVVVASGERFVRVWDRASGKVSHRFGAADGSSQYAAALSPDGRLLATGDNGRNLHLWEVATGKRLGQVQGSHPVACLAWSADGKLLAAGAAVRRRGLRAITLLEWSSTRAGPRPAGNPGQGHPRWAPHSRGPGCAGADECSLSHSPIKVLRNQQTRVGGVSGTPQSRWWVPGSPPPIRTSLTRSAKNPFPGPWSHLECATGRP